MAPPESKSLQCSFCAKAFGRTEHLKRHELIHTKNRQFSCDVCAKVFVRRDALQRHELTHQTTGPSLLSKGARACTWCASAKARCSGENLCSRCQRRGLQCIYPEVGQNALTSTTAANSGSTMSTDTLPELRPQGLPAQTSVLSGQLDQGPLIYDSSDLNADFWDPSILSTTNWLDDLEFSGLPLGLDFSHPAVHAIEAPSQVFNHAPLVSQNVYQGIHTSYRSHEASPIAVASSASAPSGISTETAADVCAAHDDSSRRVGEYCVDGEPARLPRTKRRRLSSKKSTQIRETLTHRVLSVRNPLPPDADLKHRIYIPGDTFQDIFMSWQHTCLPNTLPWPAFEQTDFPPKELFEHLLGLYFKEFHPTLPFLHPVSFDATEANWLLLLSMMAIGARFLGEDSNGVFALSLQELLRRSLFCQQEGLASDALDKMTSAQIQILHVIGLVYSGDERLTRQGLEMQQTLASTHSAVTTTPVVGPPSGSGIHEDRWRAWIQREEAIRTAYSAFVLDCMLAYHFQRRPTLVLSDASLPLPSHEKLWTAATVEQWTSLRVSQTAAPTLQESLQEIYIDKRLPKDRGEFARIIMIHGLFQRTWEIGRYFNEPITQWEPTARKQSSAEILPSRPVWLPSVPIYTKWQNSVCDCLDILHWQANATIGAASSFEHSTVAFLHLARIVLLSPINSIVNLAKSTIGSGERSELDVTHDKMLIQRWAAQGQFKSRLAVIHAGVVFWHIRRYSVDGYYESPVVALAALMLWAFATFSVKQNSSQQSHAESKQTEDESSDESTCGIILLDRPADDEIVQQFIRRGHTMRAHITGVGDLYGPRGPERVLVEGCKLLGALKCWGVNATWLDILQRLIETCKK